MDNLEGLCGDEQYKIACEEIRLIVESVANNFIKQNENIDYLISSRIKTKDSIKEKKSRKNSLEDIAGIRMVFTEAEYVKHFTEKEKVLRTVDECILYLNAYYMARQYVCHFDFFQNDCDDSFIKSFVYSLKEKGLEVINETDYISNPKKSGYKSYHLVVKASNGKFVEIQVRNYIQHLLAEWEHVYYKTGNEDFCIKRVIEETIKMVLQGECKSNILIELLRVTNHSEEQIKNILIELLVEQIKSIPKEVGCSSETSVSCIVPNVLKKSRIW